MDKTGKFVPQTILQKEISNDIAGCFFDGGNIFRISTILHQTTTN